MNFPPSPPQQFHHHHSNMGVVVVGTKRKSSYSIDDILGMKIKTSDGEEEEEEEENDQSLENLSPINPTSLSIDGSEEGWFGIYFNISLDQEGCNKLLKSS